VTTLDEILSAVERKYGRARRIWVFDRGVVSEENLATLRRRGGQYLVGTPRSKLKSFEQELLRDDWEQVRPDVGVKLVSVRGGEETYVLCRTSARQDKEKAIRSRFSSRIEDALSRLEKRVREGKLKDRGKIERRIGAILARHPQVADLYKVEVQATAEGPRVQWHMADEHRRWQELREGAYLLRTNIRGENAPDLWEKYIQLTEAEAAFRALKSELAIRPIFHQIENRVKAHVLVAFLGYALWVTLKHLLKAKGTELSPLKALALIATVQSADIVLPTTDGREIRLRRVTVPDQEQKELLDRLGWALPKRLEFDHECSGNSKSA
jgi:transposase